MKKWVVNGCYYDDSEIEKAKDDFRFFNAGDYITKEMSNSKDKIFEYIEQLENEIQALKQVHEYDVKMIDKVKGNAVKLYKEIDELKEDKQKLIVKLEEELERNKRDTELAETGKLNLSSEE